MRVLCIITVLMLCLQHTNVKPENIVSKQAIKNNHDPYCLAEYCKRVIKISTAFGDKYGNNKILRCAMCNKETLTHGDFLGLLLLKATNFFGDSNKLNVAKKLIGEAFIIFPKKPLKELISFMLNAAHEVPINCDRCSGGHWVIAEDLTIRC